jgi:hypothetical protein
LRVIDTKGIIGKNRSQAQGPNASASGLGDAMREVSLYEELQHEIFKELTREWSEELRAVKVGMGDYVVSDSFKKEFRVDVNLREVHLGNNNKLRIYALFKSEIKMEDYLRYVKDSRHRKILTKFRIGVLSLRVESGRYEFGGVENEKRLPIEFRVCECCDSVT